MGFVKLPAHVEDVFREFLTCELTTFARDGTPITWPTMPIYRSDSFQFVVLTSIGSAQKARNIRREPRVAMLFSDPTGCGLLNPPTVLVQGDARAPDQILTSTTTLDEQLRHAFLTQARKLLKRQPAVGMYVANPLTRFLMGWYFIRLGIYVTPRRVVWWDAGDVGGRPHELELTDVG